MLCTLSHITVSYAVTEQTKWGHCYIFSTGVHPLMQSTMHDDELWPIIIKLTFVRL